MADNAPADAPAPPPAETVRHLRGPARWAVSLAAWTAALWMRTWRVRWLGEDRAALAAAPGVMIVPGWHNRLLLLTECHRRLRPGRRRAAVISASRDGAYIAAFVEALGAKAARGSSSRRGHAAAREALALLRDGLDLGVTPDGPRGPAYTFKEGAAVLAKLARCPVLLLSPTPRSAWRAQSWDGFFLPPPFALIDCRWLLIADPPAWAAAQGCDLGAALAHALRDLTPPDPFRPGPPEQTDGSMPPPPET